MIRYVGLDFPTLSWCCF